MDRKKQSTSLSADSGLWSLRGTKLVSFLCVLPSSRVDQVVREGAGSYSGNRLLEKDAWPSLALLSSTAGYVV